nr:MAG TPA: hypothetical protein [Bacteriophage sp.]
METLKELRAKYNQLRSESIIIHNQIKELERQEVLSNFAVGDCYFNTERDTLIKIISIKTDYVYYILIDETYISRDSSFIYDITGWVKITSQQFKNAYLATIKDIQDPDLEDRDESNLSIILKSIVESINKE